MPIPTFRTFPQCVAGVALALNLVGLSGCGAGTQKTIVEVIAKNDGERHAAFEATARALDDHPAYVDEFYVVARRHPATMNRFLANTARDLHDPALAEPTAQRLVDNPASLRETLVATLDAARLRPPAREAISAAVVEKKEIVADILTDRRDAILASLASTVNAVERKPAARPAFLEAMRLSAPRVADLLKSDPETLKVLMAALLGAEDHTFLEGLLKKIGVVK